MAQTTGQSTGMEGISVGYHELKLNEIDNTQRHLGNLCNSLSEIGVITKSEIKKRYCMPRVDILN